MPGFDKIEFNTPPKKTDEKKSDFQPANVKNVQGSLVKSMSAKKKKLKINRKKVGITLGVVVVLLILIGIPIFMTYNSALKTFRESKVLTAAIKTEDLNLASDEIVKTKADLKETQTNLHYLIPLKFVPIASWYYNDADHLMSAGNHALDTATIVIDSLKPYADVLGLKGHGSFSGGSAQDRIKTAVMTIGKITPQIDTIAGKLSLIKQEIDQVDPHHYPKFLFGKAQDQLASARDATDQASNFVDSARPLVKILPSLLGSNESQKYLILFQNDKELRPTGGFITAYAIFNINQGVITAEKSEDIYALDATVPNKPSAPATILKYFPGVYQLNLRDTNLSPDFEKSMTTFKSMYDTAGAYTKVNGIIAIDTSVLVSTIKILDNSVTAGGINFTANNDPRCNCPQVIYELENSISRPVGYIKTERKALLGELLSALMTKALSSSPKIYWNPLFQNFTSQTSQKHVLFYLYSQDAQQGIEALNAAGQIKPFDGDYLHINEANFSGAKVNIFLQQSVDNDYQVAGDGTITKTLTLHYKNPSPPSDCNLERGNLCLNAEYRDWIRFYVPKGSRLVSSKGSQVKMTTYDELGKTVFEGFTTVRPLGVQTLTISYTLPFKLTGGSPLPVLIQKQPGTDGIQYNLTENNGSKQLDSFPLLMDKQEKLNF